MWRATSPESRTLRKASKALAKGASQPPLLAEEAETATAASAASPATAATEAAAASIEAPTAGSIANRVRRSEGRAFGVETEETRRAVRGGLGAGERGEREEGGELKKREVPSAAQWRKRWKEKEIESVVSPSFCPSSAT